MSEGEPGSWLAQVNDHLLGKGLAKSVALDVGALKFHVVGVWTQGPPSEDWLLNKLCLGPFGWPEAGQQFDMGHHVMTPPLVAGPDQGGGCKRTNRTPIYVRVTTDGQHGIRHISSRLRRIQGFGRCLSWWTASTSGHPSCWCVPG